MAPVLAIATLGGDFVAPLRQEDDYYFDEYYPSIEEKVVRKKKAVQNKLPEVKEEKVSKKAPKTKVKSNVVLGGVIFSVALTIVLRYAMINNMNMENIRLKKELNNINNVNAQLQLAAEKNVNLNEIETYARENLGLQKPQNYQIEYINVNKHDLIDNKVVVENKKGFKEFFSDLVEFVIK